MRKSRCCCRWEGDEVDSAANVVQPNYEQGVEMQTHINARAALLVIIALVFFLSCASRDERLRIAAYKGDSEESSQLIAEGAEIDAKNEYGNTALMIAAIEGHLEIVKALLAGGADVNARTTGGVTALFAAESGGHTAVVEILKRAGAN